MTKTCRARLNELLTSGPLAVLRKPFADVTEDDWNATVKLALLWLDAAKTVALRMREAQPSVSFWVDHYKRGIGVRE